MHPIISISCLLGLVLPLVILFSNRGYRTANRYLSFFLFFTSLYVFENFILFYSISLPTIAIATTFHAFFYLIGPFAFFYIRSIIGGNSNLSKIDYLHFTLFVISFIGYTPYLVTSWDYKFIIAQNIMGDNWNMAPFHLNILLPHKLDQVLNLLHACFYMFSLWYLIWYYKKAANRFSTHSIQYKRIQKWVVIFASIHTIITITFLIAMFDLWIYDNKAIFLDRAGVPLLFTSLVYIVMSMIVMFFPHIMYRLPVDLFVQPIGSELIKDPETNHSLFTEATLLSQGEGNNSTVKIDSQLFTSAYKDSIAASLQSSKDRQAFLSVDCKLALLSNELCIPIHHLSYFFNEVIKVSFSDWRNALRIEYAKEQILHGAANTITLQALSLQCGFASQSTFIRAFRKADGNSPSQYVKSLK
ncbi:MAG: AraC-like DNA-binding protein [Flavobacterium sp.]